MTIPVCIPARIPAVRRPGAPAALLIAALVAVLTLVPSPARAHTDLLGSSPAAGELVGPDLEQLVLAFADEVVPDTAAVSVTGPDDEPAGQGAPVVEGATVRVGLRLASTGTHTVAYRVVAADGHVVTGTLAFDVATGSDRPAVPPAVIAAALVTADVGPSPGPLPWVVGTSALVLLLAALHLARRRRASRPATSS